MPNPLTMEEIARELNLSRLTVSSVINDRFRERGISEATAKRVREHLARRGYVPSRSAVDLRTGVRDALGILYGGRLYSHLIEAFNELVGGYNETERRLETLVVKDGGVAGGLREMISRGVSQVIWIHRRAAALELQDAEEILAYLEHLDAVIYNYRFDDPRWDARLDELGVVRIGVDREEGFRRLGTLLREAGHSAVAVGHAEEGATFAGAPQGLRAAGLDVRFVFPRATPVWDASAAYAAALADEIVLAMRETDVTACALLDDELTAMTLVELLKRGVRVPEDLALTGFDGMPFTAFTPVPLTTLAVPVARMVEAVAKVLNGELPGREHCLPMQLVERASHGPPAQRA